MRRRILALGGAAVLAVTGCSGGAHPTSTPSTRPPSATTTAPNPDVVPNRITPAYVDAVFAKLNHIYGNAVRSSFAAHSVNESATTELRAIFNDPLYTKEVSLLQESLHEGYGKIYEPPGDRVTTVIHLISASSQCIFSETHTDFSKVVRVASPSAASEYFELRIKQAGADPSHLNPTPWAFSFNVSYQHPTTISDQC